MSLEAVELARLAQALAGRTPFTAEQLLRSAISAIQVARINARWTSTWENQLQEELVHITTRSEMADSGERGPGRGAGPPFSRSSSQDLIDLAGRVAAASERRRPGAVRGGNQGPRGPADRAGGRSVHAPSVGPGAETP